MLNSPAGFLLGLFGQTFFERIIWALKSCDFLIQWKLSRTYREPQNGSVESSIYSNWYIVLHPYKTTVVIKLITDHPCFLSLGVLHVPWNIISTHLEVRKNLFQRNWGYHKTNTSITGLSPTSGIHRWVVIPVVSPKYTHHLANIPKSSDLWRHLAYSQLVQHATLGRPTCTENQQLNFWGHYHGNLRVPPLSLRDY